MKDMFEPLELDVVKEQMATYCSFSLGKQKIRQSMPCFDKLWVQRELIRTKEALALVIRYGNLPFQGVHDISRSIEDASKDRILNPQECRYIAESIRACEHISKYFKSADIETPYLKELIDSFSEHRDVASQIEKCISQHDEVLDNASTTLKGIRKAILACSSDINIEVQRFISRNSSKLMDTITTIRNDRICVLVKISEKNSIDGLLHGESASGQTAYIEPKSLLILNNKLQSLRSKEIEEVNRILFALSQSIKAIGFELTGNLDTFALLDSLFAKALWAKANHGCVASITEKSRLYFKNARHPLIDKKQVVSNTYELTAPYRCLLITGSNTGGKTVTLKTIGLFVAMSNCGMPISADVGVIPFFDAIYVDVGDDQSIQESLSTFSSHLAKLSYICEHVTPHSLVLLDELGSGTDPKEGEPFAIAILDYLRKSNAMIIATTHYSALKNYGADNEDILLSSVAFDLELMKPTYHYVEGISGQSNAFEIARRFGVKESILADALERKERDKSKNDRAFEKLEKSLLENHELKLKLEERLLDIKALQESLLKEKLDIAKQKEHILGNVKEDAQKQLNATLEEAEDILTRLKETQKDAKPHVITKLQSALHQVGMEDDSENEDKEESFVVGDYVQIKKFNYYGEVLSINKDKVCVFANQMKMNMRLKDITHAQKQMQKKSKKDYVKREMKTISMECNVIGLRVSEALPIIDKYLDDALLAKANNVRLIHGNGTGALRKGVHEYLKHNVRVDSFHMGGQGEGGLGATVVVLKTKGSSHHG
ncbi:MAG: endonuclease MutS2 [Longicatena sp.]